MNIVYFIKFKWNIELLKRVQIQGYIARLFSIEINRKIFITI